MTNNNYRFEAQILRISRLCGIVDEKSIVDWADAKIQEGHNYVTELLEISTDKLGVLDYLSKLKSLAEGSDSLKATRIVCAKLTKYLDEDISLAKSFAQALYEIVLEHEYRLPGDLSFLCGAWDSLDLGQSGVFNLEKEETAFLKEVKKFEPQYASLFPQDIKLLALKQIVEEDFALSEEYSKNLEHQLKMNLETWKRLSHYGVQEGAAVSLDFFFYTKDPKNADGLKEYLKRFKRYQTSVSQNNEPDICVQGSTGRMKVGPKYLDAWVSWMVKAGARFNCEFDGWGTQTGQDAN